MLNGELNAFASRSSKSLEEDKSYLDGQLESFGQAIKKSKASVGKQHEDALTLNAEVARAQADLQENLMAWMTDQRQAAEKAILNIKNVQETHLAVVSGQRLSASVGPLTNVVYSGGYRHWPHFRDFGCTGHRCIGSFQGRPELYCSLAVYHTRCQSPRGEACRFPFGRLL
jgi:hypothetical protein